MRSLLMSRDIIGCLERSEKMVRPANLPMGAPGRQVAIVETNSGHRVAVISLLGRLFMKTMADCPFAAVDRVLVPVGKLTVYLDYLSCWPVSV